MSTQTRIKLIDELIHEQLVRIGCLGLNWSEGFGLTLNAERQHMWDLGRDDQIALAALKCVPTHATVRDIKLVLDGFDAGMRATS